MDYIDELYAGIDVGSTTVKLVVADISSGEILFGKYIRHEAEQMNTVKKLLIKAGHSFPGRYAKCAVSGSGGRPIAEAMEYRMFKKWLPMQQRCKPCILKQAQR